MISGFIMWTTTEDQNRGPGAFWLARIVRIVPLYWMFTTAYVMAALLTPASFFIVKLEPAHILKSYLFIPATHPNLGLVAPVYTLGWTLNYEMFFYLLFGLVPVRAIAAICACAVLPRHSSCWLRADWLLSQPGAIAAHLPRSDHAGIPRRRRCWRSSRLA